MHVEEKPVNFKKKNKLNQKHKIGNARKISKKK